MAMAMAMAMSMSMSMSMSMAGYWETGDGLQYNPQERGFTGVDIPGQYQLSKYYWLAKA
jgi:hypothetical protein